MTYSEILISVKSHRSLLLVSLLFSGILGGAATVFPISHVATMSLSNSEQYFTLAELKIIKNKIPIIAEALMQSEQDEEMKRFMLKAIVDPKWIEKNITPVFHITKADSRELLDASKNITDPYAISWINIQATTTDEQLARRSTAWIAKVIYGLGFKLKLLNFLSQHLTEAEASLLANSKLLPGLYKTFNQLEQNIKILNEINSKYPEMETDQTKLQLNLNSSERSNDLNNLSYLQAYLPLKKQLAIMETQLAQVKDSIKLAELDQSINEVKREVASQEISIIDNAKINVIIQNDKVVYAFWKKLNFAGIPGYNTVDWLKNYIETMKNNVRDSEMINVSRFERQISRSDDVFIEEKYRRINLFFASVIVGLALPMLIAFAPVLFRKITSVNSGRCFFE